MPTRRSFGGSALNFPHSQLLSLPPLTRAGLSGHVRHWLGTLHHFWKIGNVSFRSTMVLGP